MSDEQLFQDPNTAFKASLMSQNLFKALSELQSIDAETLMQYQTSDFGRAEIDVLMRDLVFFEAKTSKDFMRGLCVGIAASIQDFLTEKNGDAVVPTLRAGLSLLRSSNTDVITGKEADFNATR